MNTLLAAVRFLTIVPLGPVDDDVDYLGRSTPFFPLVGLVIGLFVAAAAHLLTGVAPAGLAVVVIVLLLAAVSGGLHVDGLSDTADGFLSSRPRERVLEIMRDSHIGVMGVLAILFVMAIKITSLASLEAGTLWRTVLLMPLAGRCSLVLMLGMLPYVRGNSGLGSLFSRRQAVVCSPVVLIFSIAVGGWLLGFAGGAAAVGAACVTVLFASLCVRKIGGATGDTYGAACEISEAVVAVVVAMLMHAPAAPEPVKVDVASVPQRIVSQTLGTDEVLFAICPVDRIAGISSLSLDERFSHCVAEARAVEDRVCADVEQVIAADPDLVLLAHYAQPEAADQLRAVLDAPVVQLSTFDSLDDIRSNIRRIGKLVGREREAAALIDEMDRRITVAASGDTGRPRVVSYSQAGYTAGAETIFDDVLRTVGARNVAAENGVHWFSHVGMERIAAWDPDVIVASSETEAEAAGVRAHLLAQPALAATSAGRSGRIIVVSDKELLTVSHHIAGLVETLVARLYPANEVTP